MTSEERVVMDETGLRAGLRAAADKATPPADLLERVANARSRAKRNQRLVVGIYGPFAILLITVGIVVAVRQIVELPEGSSDSAMRSSATSTPGRGADCASTDDGQAASNDRLEPPVIDPATTEIRVCHYSMHAQGYTLDKTAVLTGPKAATLVRRFNTAPAANPSRRCMANREQEVWTFVTGNAVTAEVQVELGGCGFAYDGHHTIAWPGGSALS